MKNKLIKNSDLRIGISDYSFYCQGCKCHHGVWIKKENYAGPVWDFNNDIKNPTFYPSIKVEWIYCEYDQITSMPIQSTRKIMICHSFITNGKIQYLSDCTHKLAGQTIDLSDEDE